jgi:hypothetical protein
MAFFNALYISGAAAIRWALASLGISHRLCILATTPFVGA